MLRGIKRRTDVATFFIGGLAASELMWIIRMENNRTDFERKTKAQITITRDVVERLKRGEKVDVQKELLQGEGSKEETVSSILSSLEEMDNKWGQSSGNVLLSRPQDRPTQQQPEKEIKKDRWL